MSSCACADTYKNHIFPLFLSLLTPYFVIISEKPRTSSKTICFSFGVALSSFCWMKREPCWSFANSTTCGPRSDSCRFGVRLFLRGGDDGIGFRGKRHYSLTDEQWYIWFSLHLQKSHLKSSSVFDRMTESVLDGGPPPMLRPPPPPPPAGRRPLAIIA